MKYENETKNAENENQSVANAFVNKINDMLTQAYKEGFKNGKNAGELNVILSGLTGASIMLVLMIILHSAGVL